MRFVLWFLILSTHITASLTPWGEMNPKWKHVPHTHLKEYLAVECEGHWWSPRDMKHHPFCPCTLERSESNPNWEPHEYWKNCPDHVYDPERHVIVYKDHWYVPWDMTHHPECPCLKTL